MKYILEYDMVNGLATSVDPYTGNDRVGVEYESDEPYGEPGQYRYQIFNSKADVIDFIEDMRIDASMVDNLYEKTNRGKTMERQRRNRRVREGKKFIIAEGQILKTTCGSYVESTGTEEFIVEACGRKSFKRPMGKGLNMGDEPMYASPMKRGMEDDMEKGAMKRSAMRKKMAMRKRAMGRKGIGFSQDYSKDKARMVDRADPR